MHTTEVSPFWISRRNPPDKTVRAGLMASCLSRTAANKRYGVRAFQTAFESVSISGAATFFAF
jgi:hypothetical protein